MCHHKSRIDKEFQELKPVYRVTMSSKLAKQSVDSTLVSKPEVQENMGEFYGQIHKTFGPQVCHVRPGPNYIPHMFSSHIFTTFSVKHISPDEVVQWGQVVYVETARG